MRMNSRLAAPLLCAAALACVAPGLARADDLDAETKARIARFEKGPATVDVSKYPKAIQENYEVFAEKCAQCHKLSRPINSDYALPNEWERYVKRMMHKPGSGISSGEGKKIFDFLVYDSSIRKKAMVEEHLDKTTPEERAADEKKIAEIRAKYDK
jgi:hypothetical protein